MHIKTEAAALAQIFFVFLSLNLVEATSLRSLKFPCYLQSSFLAKEGCLKPSLVETRKKFVGAARVVFDKN